MTERTLPLIDVITNRQVAKYSKSEQVRRVFWMVGSRLISLSPRPAFGWRRMVLRLFGAKVGKQVNIYPSTRIYMPWNVELGDLTALGEDTFIYSLGKVTLGRNVTVSYRAHLCAGTHDLNDPALPLLKPPITLDEGVWVGTDAFIGPGVCVGKFAVVGARAVVIKDVVQLQVVAGNPAKCVGLRSIQPQTNA